MAKAKRRIPYAYLYEGWSFKTGNPNELQVKANKIGPTEYEAHMDGKIFCPVCFTNLNRIPKEKELFSNQREAFFAHQKNGFILSVICVQQSLKARDMIHGKMLVKQ